jgi:hypothetical protein
LNNKKLRRWSNTKVNKPEKQKSELIAKIVGILVAALELISRYGHVHIHPKFLGAPAATHCRDTKISRELLKNFQRVESW